MLEYNKKRKIKRKAIRIIEENWEFFVWHGQSRPGHLLDSARRGLCRNISYLAQNFRSSAQEVEFAIAHSYASQRRSVHYGPFKLYTIYTKKDI